MSCRTDQGMTWQFLSTVAEGGAPIPQNGNTPVWEPFLLLHRDRLICFYSQRPGMTTVAQVHDSMWIMTHEAGGNSGDNFYAVHYKMARDPESFGPAAEHVLHDQNGYIPSAAPVVSWSDSGGPAGTIVVTANSDQDFFNQPCPR